MKVVVLASGSTGNSTYIEINNHHLLIDIGKNCKYIVNKLAQIGVKAEDIEYIFISHLHDDHISALKTFLKKYQPTIVISQKMFNELNDIQEYDHLLIYEDEVFIDNIHVYCMHSSHDATDSRNFLIEYNNESIVYVTDTGYVNQKNFKYLQNKNVYLFEANHDIEMLQHGTYPDWLKSRVLSDYGHLSNYASSVYLSKLIGENTQKICLMHLSKQNNTEELALKEIKEIFNQNNILFDDIKCAKADEVSEVLL